MRVGIVGAERAKFTKTGKNRACRLIGEILSDPGVTEVVSGACHLGGVDNWAAEIGKEKKIAVKEFPPANLSWLDGYRPRNLRIVERSDVVHCITVDKLPEDFAGMRFELCYHCGSKDHVKSGGCWTMKKAREEGKKGKLHIIRND